MLKFLDHWHADHQVSAVDVCGVCVFQTEIVDLEPGLMVCNCAGNFVTLEQCLNAEVPRLLACL